MKIDEARDGIGRQVIYCPREGVMEDGEIVSVNDTVVMVRYKHGVKATRSRDIRFTLPKDFNLWQ